MGHRITAMAPVTGQWSVLITKDGDYSRCPVVAWASLAFDIVVPGDVPTETQPVFVYGKQVMTEAEFRAVYGDAKFEVGPV
ncbi:hypothetical protein R6V09_12435 [Streptomyces sp. W16]|uniref:hypothetical protein n=1 Tax=Streptomyces sp. W16 TaxID=3076631 RepID=UPI00295BF478|nr:hypothetical protein [Streptomyces sp. W16]MDV9170939.1 hypothetical protein [Streptomyces sp. W16]